MSCCRCGRYHGCCSTTDICFGAGNAYEILQWFFGQNTEAKHAYMLWEESCTAAGQESDINCSPIVSNRRAWMLITILLLMRSTGGGSPICCSVNWPRSYEGARYLQLPLFLDPGLSLVPRSSSVLFVPLIHRVQSMLLVNASHTSCTRTCAKE